jgi:UDP-N-acetylmuramoyl-tripeptide--D-alanyl-D-alanine ligase
MEVTLARLAAKGGGKLIQGRPETIVRGLSPIPGLTRGDIVLVTPRWLPHARIGALANRGVPVVATVGQARGINAPGGLIIVPNVARWFDSAVPLFRAKLRVPVVGITGSAGKSSTRNMLLSMVRVGMVVKSNLEDRNIAAEAGRVISCAGPGVQAVVLEMGMSGHGQIARQCHLARPTVGIITNVGRAHVLGCGGFMGVVRCKNEMVWGIRRGGVLILNADDRGSRLLKTKGFRGKTIRFGQGEAADYRLLNLQYVKGGVSFMAHAEGEARDFFLPTIGRHQVYNALAAMAAARAIGVAWEDIRTGLANFRPPRHRLALRPGFRESLVIDDTFNANPLSTAAALRTLKEVAHGRHTVAVLGQMTEQGADSVEQHKRLGRKVAAAGVTRLITVGAPARAIAAGARAAGMAPAQITSFSSRAGVLRDLPSFVPRGSVILVKGSHVTNMTEVVGKLVSRKNGATAHALELGAPTEEESANGNVSEPTGGQSPWSIIKAPTP